jgi:hypothetical protein
MKKYNMIFLILLFSVLSCTKKGVTPTTVKLNVSGILSLAGGAGSGGGVLYGRSAQGELFGQPISNNSEVIVLPNGDWVFYAFLWDSTSTPASPMNDNVFCGKGAYKLSGSDVYVNLNLSNANCTDPEFSNGKTYVDANGKNRFSDIFWEECDELNALTNFACGVSNQGSARSYRMVMRSFKKTPGAEINFNSAAITSACQVVNKSLPGDLLHKGLPVNFPSGNGIAPFVVSVEMFLGSDTCDVSDPKGMHTVLLKQGFGGENLTNDKLLVSTNTCQFSTAAFSSITDEEVRSFKCEEHFGVMSAGICDPSGILPVVSRFTPAAACLGTLTASPPTIKHLVSIPKSFLCDRYNGASVVLGSHPFAGGNGSVERPYKVCNEWQMNQIGEVNAASALSSSSFKLMNDLDMNKTDFLGPYEKPSCVGVVNSILRDHHNLNSLDKIISSDCSSAASVGSGYQGNFNGNGKTIKNARILASSADKLGFVRKLNLGTIKNLTFQNLEVSGGSNVGGIAGEVIGVNTQSSIIKNIWQTNGQVEAESNSGAGGSYVGGVAGQTNPFIIIKNVHLDNVRVRGKDYVAGLVGSNNGKIDKSHFRGDVENQDGSGSIIGGLVANNGSSATISNSYSEGQIFSLLPNTGGIAGANFGAVSSVYSSMSIQVKSSIANAAVGGIIGVKNSVATLTNAFFDGVIRPSLSGASPQIGGVVGSNSGSNGVNCYTTHPTPGAGCTTMTYAQMRDNTTLTFSSAADWQRYGYSLPRLSWESRECISGNNQYSLSTQVSNLLRGSVLNPLIICNSTQLSELSGRSAAEFYRVAEDINLKDRAFTDLIDVLNGALDGDGKILYGMDLDLTTHSQSYIGLFKAIALNASVKNIKIYGNRLLNSSNTSDDGTGILVGNNSGSLSDIVLKGNELAGHNKVGTLVGYNSGTINDVSIRENSVAGFSLTGGLGGENAGILKRIDTQAEIKNVSVGGSSYYGFGGVVGKNSNSIDQVRFAGTIDLGPTTATYLNAGGLVGINEGSITNSYTDSYSKMFVKSTSNIGGLVGLNSSTGTISHSFAIGKIIYDYSGAFAPVSQPLNPLVGVNSGSIAASVFFLERNVRSFLSGATTDGACTNSAGTILCTTSSSYNDTDSTYFSLSTFSMSKELDDLIPLVSKPSSLSFTYTGTLAPAASQSLSFYRPYASSVTGSALKTAPQFKLLNQFCSNWSGTSGNEVCIDGFDIVGFDTNGSSRYGDNRMYSYYQSYFDETPAPANAPIWEMDEKDSYPSLMQLKHR